MMFQQSINRLFVLITFFAWSSLALGSDIFDVAKNGDLEQAKLLLESNPSLVFSNNSDAGFTPLHWAVRHNHPEMVKLLLANKANIDAPDRWGRTSLYFATYADNKEIVELLLHSNACVRCEVSSLFLFAINNHDFEMMQLFLTYGADIDTRNKFGMTPLAETSETNMAKWLLANGADINARDATGEGGTPLHWAALSGRKDVAELLIASNSNVNAKDLWGETPLHAAARHGRIAVAELLLAKNSDINATNNSGNTPLQLAFDNKDMAAFLRQHGGHGNEVKTKPLVGWYLDGDSDSQHDKAILDDYQAYAHKVWPKDRDFFISEVDFYENGAGKHAVRIELEPGLRDYVEYYLIYDTNNVRTKVIKGKTWHQFHM